MTVSTSTPQQPENENSNEIENASLNAPAMVLPVYQLFQFANKTEILLMFFGLLNAMAYGVTQPMLSLILGDVIQPFLEFEIARATNASGLDSAANKLRDEVTKQVILFTCIGVGTMVAAYFMQAFWSYAGERQTRRVRAKFIASALNQDLAWFDDHKAGDLTTQLTSDTLMFQEGISERSAQGLGYITQFFAGFIIAFTQNWKLTLALMATFPGFAISGIIVGRVFAEGTSQSQGAYAAAGAVAQETLAQIRTVAAYGGQNRAVKKFTKLLDSVVKVNERKAWIAGGGFAVFFGLLYALFALAFWYGGTLVQNGEIQGGDVVKVIFAVVIGVFSVLNISPSIQALAKARAAGYRLFEVIKSVPSVVDGTETISNFHGRVRFENVTFAYPARKDVIVLDNFSLTVEPGQTVALVGLSGSGKSTTVQILERYYDVISGVVYLDNTPLPQISLKWLRTNIGLVSQEPVLFQGSIAENIAYGAAQGTIVTDEMLAKVCQEANALEFILKLPEKFHTNVGERGSLLSGGQRQRIAIARALIKNPQVLLLDEATSALDTESEGVVQDALDRASKGRTTIVIAHRLSTIRKANKIVVMNKGQIVEQGTHESLLAAGGTYAGLVKAQELKTAGTAAMETGEKDAIAHDSEALVNPTDSVQVTDVSKKSDTVVSKDLLDSMSLEECEKAEMAAILKQRRVPLWRLVRLQLIEWHVLSIGIFMGTVNGFALPAFGVLLGESIGVFRLQGDELRSQSLMWTYLFLGLMAASGVCNFLQFGCFGISGERLTRRIRETAFSAMLRQEIAWFDDPDNSTGALTAKLSDQADKIQQLTGPNLANLLQLVVSLGSSITLALYYSWRQALVVIACMPILALGSIFEARFTTGSVNSSRKAYAVAAQLACDAIANIATVKSLAREQDFIDGYLASVKKPYRSGVRKALIGSWGFGFSQAVQFFVYAIAFYSGYIFVRDGYMKSGDLFSCIFVILFGSISFAQAATFGPNIIKAKVAAISYFDLIDRIPLIDTFGSQGLTPVDVGGQVSLEKGEFRYANRPDVSILQGLNINAMPGMSVALVGTSGSGKSTVLALALRFYELTKGTTMVEKVDVKDWNLQYLRCQMAIVSQEPSLFNGTIRENIMYGVPDEKTATEEEMIESCKAANIHEFIESLPDKYNTLITSSQLSGGQKQRVCVARALIRKPKILLLDEATSALDSNAEQAVQAALDAASQGRTTITIAHRLSTIQNCDLIYVISNGAVMEEGTHMELLDMKGLYHKLVHQQKLGKDSSA